MGKFQHFASKFTQDRFTPEAQTAVDKLQATWAKTGPKPDGEKRTHTNLFAYASGGRTFIEFPHAYDPFTFQSLDRKDATLAILRSIFPDAEQSELTRIHSVNMKDLKPSKRHSKLVVGEYTQHKNFLPQHKVFVVSGFHNPGVRLAIWSKRDPFMDRNRFQEFFPEFKIVWVEESGSEKMVKIGKHRLPAVVETVYVSGDGKNQFAIEQINGKFNAIFPREFAEHNLYGLNTIERARNHMRNFIDGKLYN